MPRQIRDPRARDQLIEAVRRLIAAHGLTGASVRTIAEAAGVSTGSVTHYFEEKRALLHAALERNNELAGRLVADAVVGQRGIAAVERAALALLPLDDDRIEIWSVWVAFWSDRSASGPHGPLAGGYRGLRGILTRHLAEAVADGDVPRGADLDYEAERLVMLLGGIGLMGGTEDAGRDRVRRTARRMLADHFAALRLANLPAGIPG